MPSVILDLYLLICSTFWRSLFFFVSPEAEYAYQRRKTIIPLMMDKHYQPNGWLGMILGTKYYIDFSGRHIFSEQSHKLLREVCDIGSAALLEGKESK